MSARNLILTGLPRSGTTLACALVDSLDDAVCLSEPPWQDTWPRETDDRRACARRVHQDFEGVRELLLAGGEVIDRRQPGGAPVTDYFSRVADGSRATAFALVPLRRSGLSENFLLGMKQNAHYTCMLEELAEHDDFEIIAIVRHPLATIRSWRAARDLPISQGRLPAAERLWPQMAALTAATADILLRQVIIYRVFCERYRALGKRVHLLRYEDLVLDQTPLAALCGRVGFLRQVQIAPRTMPPDAAETSLIADYLRKHGAVAAELYPDLNR